MTDAVIYRSWWCWETQEDSEISDWLGGGSKAVVNLLVNAEAEAPILWPPDAKRGLTGSHPDAGKDCGQEERGDRG